MAVPLPRLTPEEYLAIERRADHRSEYFDGEMFAMAGGSADHSDLCGCWNWILRNRLAGRGCKVYTSDMRVRTPASGFYAYPDVSVICGKPIFATEQRDVLTNPTLIVEILSESTEAKDRGFKFQHYKQISSLQEYVLVSQWEPLIERFGRAPGGEWTEYSDAKGLDATIALKSLTIEIPLTEVYDGIQIVMT